MPYAYSMCILYVFFAYFMRITCILCAYSALFYAYSMRILCVFCEKSQYRFFAGNHNTDCQLRILKEVCVFVSDCIKAGTHRGRISRYASRFWSSSLVSLVCFATISLSWEMRVPKSDTAVRNRKMQKIWAPRPKTIPPRPSPAFVRKSRYSKS